MCPADSSEPGQTPDHERLVLPESSGERFDPLGDLRPHPLPGVLRQHFGVAFTGNEGFEHRPGGDAGQVADNAGQLDAGALQKPLQAVDLPGSVLHGYGPGTGQIQQFPDGFRRHEGGP